MYNEGTSTTNTTNGYSNIHPRLGPWYTRIPDKLSLTLAGWRHADLVPGDLVQIESEYILNMVNAAASSVTAGGSAAKHHLGTRDLVTSVDVDWDGFTVNVELSTPPETNSRY